MSVETATPARMRARRYFSLHPDCPRWSPHLQRIHRRHPERSRGICTSIDSTMTLRSVALRVSPASVLALLFSLACGGSNATGPGPGQSSTTHPALGTISSTLTLSGRPHGIAIATSGRFCVSQIDAASITCGMLTASDVTLLQPILVDLQPAHVALSADGNQAYTANQFGSSLSIVNLGTSAVATIALSSQGFNVLADPGSSRVYVTTSTGS